MGDISTGRRRTGHDRRGATGAIEHKDPKAQQQERVSNDHWNNPKQRVGVPRRVLTRDIQKQSEDLPT